MYVRMVLLALDNLKRRTILALIYAGGLRVNEIVRLKREDIDKAMGLIYICRV